MTSLPDGMFLDSYGNSKREVNDLSGEELRYFGEYRRQQLARNIRQDALRRGAAAQAAADQAAAAQAAAAQAAAAQVNPADTTPAEEIVALNPNLTPVGIEETMVPPTIPNLPSLELPPVAAPTPPTIPNLPSLELPQMVPPVQEGIASLAPQPMVPAPQPFIPAPAPTNTGYNFQELLNMYKNPYA